MLSKIFEMIILTIKWGLIIVLVLLAFSFAAAFFGSEIGLDFIDRVFSLFSDVVQIFVDFINWIFGGFEKG